MSFVRAFLESGRSRLEQLEHLEGVQIVALESFALDAGQIVEIFNSVLSEDSGFSLSVRPVQDFQSGFVMNIPEQNSEVRQVFVDLGYLPRTQEYSVSERGSGVTGNYGEFEMQMAVAEIILKNLPDEQYIKFYRAIQSAAPEETASPVSAVQAFGSQAEDTFSAVGSPEFVPIEQLLAGHQAESVQQSATVTPFPNSHMPQQQPATQVAVDDDEEDDEDDIWGEDEDDGDSSTSPVSKHLSTDVNMR